MGDVGRELGREASADMLKDLAQEAIPIPGLGALSRAAVDAVAREHGRRISRALRRAEQLSGLQREDIEDALSAGSESIHLVVRFLYAAGQNGHDRILDMMGAVLAEGIQAGRRGDAGTLRNEELILSAIESLQPEHVDLLQHMSLTDAKPSRWTVEGLAASADVSREVLELLLAGLQRTALVSVGSGYGALVYEVTPVGYLVLRAADEVSSTDTK